MSTSEHMVSLTLEEATTDQLHRELAEARSTARRCEEQGTFLHTWTQRAEALEAELRRRRRAWL